MSSAGRKLLSTSSETFESALCRPAPSAQPYLSLGGSGILGGGPTPDRLIGLAGETDIGRAGPEPGRSGRFLAVPDRSVSSIHARISQTGRGYEIVDLASRNGTFVDGRSVSRQDLGEGSVVFLGGYAAVFRLLSEDAVAAIQEDLREPFGPVATSSPAMAVALRKLRKLAPTAEPVLLTGETGTGKEVYARAIHRASGRTGKFVGLNCAALPTELVESELFGYVRGAHSQAAQAKRGLIEQAEGGTLFLDEIGDMPRIAQAKLLRFLQEREVLALGGAQARRVDVRVLAATAQVNADGDKPALRRDLLMRLGTQPIELPPLRERPEDIGALAHHFLGGTKGFENPAFFALCLHDWPGNVRELEKVIREAVIFSEGKDAIGLVDLPAAVAGRLGSVGEPVARRRSPRPAPTRLELEAHLRRHGGNVAEVARDLDRRWAVVWRWMKRHRLEPDQFRQPR